MIGIQKESFMATLDELKPIFEIHYKELALNKDKVPLSPQYEVYEQHEQNGELLFITAREDGELIGYFIGFIAPGLHYSTCLTCTMDIFYIHPSHRGNNFGKRLFDFIERELKCLKVDRWFVGSKNHRSIEAFFLELDFEPVETYFSKWIGD